MKGGTYTKSLAKIQVREMFRIRDIRRNDVLPKLIEIVWRRHAGVHLDGHELRQADGNQQKHLLPSFAIKA